jgi:hypothetical protein
MVQVFAKLALLVVMFNHMHSLLCTGNSEAWPNREFLTDFLIQFIQHLFSICRGLIAHKPQQMPLKQQRSLQE